jgi:hypothetical protein
MRAAFFLVVLFGVIATSNLVRAADLPIRMRPAPQPSTSDHDSHLVKEVLQLLRETRG